MKIRPLGAELFHADRQTDRRDEASSRFSQLVLRMRLKKKKAVQFGRTMESEEHI